MIFTPDATPTGLISLFLDENTSNKETDENFNWGIDEYHPTYGSDARIFITLDNDGQDEVVGMICIKDLETESVMVVSEQGYGKRSEIEDYRKTNRGGKGVKTMNITEKTGKLVTIKSVTDENDLMIINKSGITIRLKVADVRIMGRATQGVRLINLEKRNDQIGSVCKVMTESLEDEIPAEEAEGTIVSDPNADAPDIDDAADVNENESNNEIEE